MGGDEEILAMGVINSSLTADQTSIKEDDDEVEDIPYEKSVPHKEVLKCFDQRIK